MIFHRAGSGRTLINPVPVTNNDLRERARGSTEDAHDFAFVVDDMKFMSHNLVGGFALGERQLWQRDTRQSATEKTK